MNCDPLTVMVDVPSEKLVGVTVVMSGIGFKMLSVTEPGVSCGKFVARLVMVTVLLGVGIVAGAVYKPLLSIVPTWAFPPSTPFTQKFIGDPVTSDWVCNCSVWATRTVLAGAEIKEG